MKEAEIMVIIAAVAVGIILLCIISKLLFPSTQKSSAVTSKPVKKSNKNDTQFVEGLVALGGVLLAGWAVATIAKKGFSVLKDIDWDSVGVELKQAVEQATIDIQNISENADRLSRAESLLSAGDKISIDQAAMLASATLELGLKTLCQRQNIVIPQENEGMIGIAGLLKDSVVISQAEYNNLRSFVAKVRNPVMHGEFHTYDRSDVEWCITFVKNLFTAHSLM